MTLTTAQTFTIVCMVTLGAMTTRFLPFIVFKNKTNKYINYLGQVLPYSAIGLLVVYCLKGVNLSSPVYGLPELIAIVCIVILHKLRGNSLLSIGAGTVVYMLLVQFVFK